MTQHSQLPKNMPFSCFRPATLPVVVLQQLDNPEALLNITPDNNLPEFTPFSPYDKEHQIRRKIKKESKINKITVRKFSSKKCKLPLSRKKVAT